MKKAKLAFGLFIVGVGAVSSAFTTKLTSNAAGWYGVTPRAFSATGATPAYGTTDVAQFPVTTDGPTTPPDVCDPDPDFICAVYYEQDNPAGLTFITGAFNE